jgi:hypothetical protein
VALIGVALCVEIARADVRSLKLQAIGPPLSTDLVRMLHDAGAVASLRIANVRIEVPPAHAPKPSSLLKFDMLNEGDLRVADVQIEIAIVDNKLADDGDLQSRPIVGPFRISGHATIEAGYTVNYEMLLRNLNPECPCVATVRVVSARRLNNQ